MAMNPRTHPRGAPPDFSMAGLPPKPSHGKVTDAMWWLICMHELLVPSSKHGGNYVNKPGGHNIGRQLPDHGLGNPKTDHSIRRAPDRRGPWWRDFTAAEDWTFPDADEMQKYAMRLYRSLKDPNDIRGDDVFQYFLGDTDGDPHIEGWHEYTDSDTTGDSTHMWHQHRQYRRDIVGNYWAMWKALTIDMGWTMAEWLASTRTPSDKPQEDEMQLSDRLWPKDKPTPAWGKVWVDAHPGADPTVYNLLFHTGTTVDRLERQVAALQEQVDALTAAAEPDPGTEAETISRGGFNPAAHPEQP